MCAQHDAYRMQLEEGRPERTRGLPGYSPENVERMARGQAKSSDSKASASVIAFARIFGSAIKVEDKSRKLRGDSWETSPGGCVCWHTTERSGAVNPTSKNGCPIQVNKLADGRATVLSVHQYLAWHDIWRACDNTVIAKPTELTERACPAWVGKTTSWTKGREAGLSDVGGDRLNLQRMAPASAEAGLSEAGLPTGARITALAGLRLIVAGFSLPSGA